MTPAQVILCDATHLASPELEQAGRKWHEMAATVCPVEVE